MQSRKIVVLGKVWPEPKSSAAGSRIMQLLELFQSNKWEIVFASAASKSSFSADLETSGIDCFQIELNNSSFDDFIRKLNPDVVLFDRFMTEEQFGWRVAEHCAGALRMLDTEDLHCLRFGREQAWKKGREFDNSDLISDVAKREIASIWRCDLSLIISEYEMNLLKNFFKVDQSLLFHLPFMLNELEKTDIDCWADYHHRANFVSIGNFLHEPNWNAVLYLKEEIWPLIRAKLPKAELHIYGAYSSQKVEQLDNPKEGFLIKGRADDAKKVVGQARVMLAPLRFGAGLKGKLIEAMQCGTPSVTTDIGAESMHGDFLWPGMIANNADELANAAVELYSNEDRWKTSQEQGIQIINGLYPEDELGEKLVNNVSELLENLKNHRRDNFTGAMLQHHHLASTRFMSKWIEAKNRTTD
ncbi:MAG: glycosyltransferase [Balneolaceae bacterium]